MSFNVADVKNKVGFSIEKFVEGFTEWDNKAAPVNHIGTD